MSDEAMERYLRTIQKGPREPFQPLIAKSRQDTLDSEQRRKYRGWMLVGMGVLLLLQLATVVTVLLFQGFEFRGFSLDNYVLGAVSTVILVQTFLLARTMILYVFPIIPHRRR